MESYSIAGHASSRQDPPPKGDPNLDVLIWVVYFPKPYTLNHLERMSLLGSECPLYGDMDP